jgi:NitT/TauT family transport system permease protein
MSRTLTRALRAAAPPVILLAVVLALWQTAVVAFDVPSFLVPTPLDVLRAGWSDFAMYSRATWTTATSALAGLGMSVVAGTLIAFLFSQSRMIRRSCYPYAIFLQTVPVIAIAPLIINWFGHGPMSIAAVAFILSLFPVITNGTAGMLEVDPDLVDLFRLSNASRWQVLFKLRLPNSVPYLLTGVRTASGLAVIGAIVGEFFAAYEEDRFGLGYLIGQQSMAMRTDRLFAAVIASTLLGVTIFGAVTFVGETINRRWYDRGSAADAGR